MMKIVSWNCNGGFRNKTEQIDTVNADLLIIQECEDPLQSTEIYRKWAGDHLWVGDSKNKGIGVFPKNGNKVKALDWKGSFRLKGIHNKSQSVQWDTSSLKLFLPFSVNDEFQILGVWTKGADSLAFGYIGQLWKYLQIHKSELSSGNQLIIGDFNSNVIWDKIDRWWNHSDVVYELDRIGLTSLYHHAFNESQGHESIPTFFHQKKQSKPFHIDYVFCSEKYLQSSISVGKAMDWLQFSDHMPIVVEI